MKENMKIGSSKIQRMNRQRKIRRDTIISEAEKAFLKKGYADTKIDEIALDAGYTKASLYNYFGSKDDLFAAVLSRIYERMYETFKEFLNQKGTDVSLRMIADAHLSFINTYPGQAEMLDSGRCVIINRNILEKQRRVQELTESEKEFQENESRIGMFVVDVIKIILQKYGIEGKVDPLKLTKALFDLNTVILSIVKRGKSVGQSDEEIMSTLSVLLNIIEQGVKHYED